MQALKSRITEFLHDLEDIHFVDSAISESLLIGSVNGVFYSLLVIEGIGKGSKTELEYQNNVMKAGGEACTIRSLSDLCHLAKERAWL
jgi:hypothetical protein